MGSQSHNWQNWHITSNITEWGVHNKINKFIVNPGVTLSVDPLVFNGSTYEKGFIEVHCREALIHGTINASGAGWGGGGGGSGSRGENEGGNNPGGIGGTGASNGSVGGVSGGPGGDGGNGGGPFHGNGGVDNGENGGHGWYNAYNTNSDTAFVNEDVFMGSGGGGGGGGYGIWDEHDPTWHHCGGGGGGGGGSGGGIVKIFTNIIFVYGSIISSGVSGGNGGNGGGGDHSAYGGAGGNGANISTGNGAYGAGGYNNGLSGGNGGLGGSGAGGGIFISCGSGLFKKYNFQAGIYIKNRVNIKENGTIYNLAGGPYGTLRGGSIKIVYSGALNLNGIVLGTRTLYKNKMHAYLL